MTWTTSETPSTGARRLDQPPPKSPAPSATEEARPRTTTARPGPKTSAVGRDLVEEVTRDVGRDVGSDRLVVQLRRPGQRDDGVGRGVVAIRGRQVDHLEILRDVAEQLERPPCPLVVERHERVVEDERWPAVAGDEPHQPDPRDEVDQVERALAQRGHVDPVAAFRGVDPDVERPVVDL